MTREEILHGLEKIAADEGLYDDKKPNRELEQLKGTAKNNLEVDAISRQGVLDKIQRLIDAEQNNIDEHGDYMNYARERVNAYEAVQFFVENDCLCPSVTSQEPMLDKIRAEIEALSNANPSYWHSGDMVDRDDVLEIINKYKGRK